MTRPYSFHLELNPTSYTLIRAEMSPDDLCPSSGSSLSLNSLSQCPPRTITTSLHVTFTPPPLQLLLRHEVLLDPPWPLVARSRQASTSFIAFALNKPWAVPRMRQSNLLCRMRQSNLLCSSRLPRYLNHLCQTHTELNPTHNLLCSSRLPRYLAVT